MKQTQPANIWTMPVKSGDDWIPSKCKIQHSSLKQGVLFTSCERNKSRQQRIRLQDRMTAPVAQRLKTPITKDLMPSENFKEEPPWSNRKTFTKSASLHSSKQTNIGGFCKVSHQHHAPGRNTAVVKTSAAFAVNDGNGSFRRLQSVPRAPSVPVQVIRVTLLWVSATCDFLILTNAWLQRGYLPCGCIQGAAAFFLHSCSGWRSKSATSPTLRMQRRIAFLIRKHKTRPIKTTEESEVAIQWLYWLTWGIYYLTSRLERFCSGRGGMAAWLSFWKHNSAAV